MKPLITFLPYFFFSDAHFSLFANVVHLPSGCISPQHHLVFLDLYESVFKTDNDDLLDNICIQLINFDFNYYHHDDKYTSNDSHIFHPHPLGNVWLSDPQHHAHCSKLIEYNYLTEDYKLAHYNKKTSI